MDYYKNVRLIEDKLSEVLAPEKMVFSASNSKYPYILSISQDRSTEAQMEIYAMSDGKTSSHDAAIRFIFELDGLVIRTDSRVIVSDAFMNKIKGLAKKLHYAWLQAYYAEHTAATDASTTTEGNTEEDDDDVIKDAEDIPVDDTFAGFFDDPEDE